MLINLTIWLIIFFHSYGLGKLLLNTSAYKEVKLSLVLLTGLFINMGVLSVLHFFIPMGLWALLIVSLLSIIGLLSRRKVHSKLELDHVEKRILFIVVLIYVLFKSVQEPIWADSRFYHAQIIQWYNEYPITKGIANLFCAYGLNSLFHLSASLYTMKFLFGEGVPSAMISFYILLFAYYLIANYYKGFMTPLFLLIFFFTAFWNWESSPSPDVVICILISIGFLELTNGKNVKHKDVFLLLSFVLVPLIKQSAFMYSFLAIPYFFKENIFERHLKLVLVLAFIIGVSWLVRNIILSGYPFYPMQWFDVFNFQHKVPDLLIQKWINDVRHFARLPLDNWRDVIGMSFLEWLPSWFNAHRKSDKILMILSIIGLIIPLFRIRKIDLNMKTYSLIVIFFTIIYALLTFPNLRFFYAFLFIVSSWTLNEVLNRAPTLILKHFSKIVASLFVMGSLYTVIKYDIAKKVNFPANYSTSKLASIETKEKVVIYYPQIERCADMPIPCGYHFNRKELHTFTNNVKDGFFIKNLYSKNL